MNEEETEMIEAVFMDGFIEGYEAAERDLQDEIGRLLDEIRTLRAAMAAEAA